MKRLRPPAHAELTCSTICSMAPLRGTREQNTRRVQKMKSMKEERVPFILSICSTTTARNCRRRKEEPRGGGRSREEEEEGRGGEAVRRSSEEQREEEEMVEP